MNRECMEIKSREKESIAIRLERARSRNLYSEYELNVLWPAFLLNEDKLEVNKNK